MVDQNEVDPGLHTVMNNMSIGARNPFRSYPTLGEQKEEATADGLQLVFDKAVTEQMTGLATELGFANLPDFINTAVSVYGQMLKAAHEEGYTRTFMLNPDTEAMISVSLTSDGM